MTIMLEEGLQARPWSEDVVSVADLNVDRSYQRAPIEGHVREMGRAYDLVLANYIYVNRRENGTLWIIDGQQRWLAARKAGEVEMFAIVVEGLTRKEEAELYFNLNKQRRPLTSVDKFKGAYAAGDRDAHAIHKLVRALGGHVKGVDGNGDAISAVAALQNIYTRSGESGLRDVLAVVHDSWDGISNFTCHANVLTGIHLLISEHPEANRERLIQRLREVGPLGLRQRAGAFGMAQGTVNSFTYYLALIDTYNARLRSQRIEPKPKSSRTAHIRRHFEEEK